jgi:hypothetical protein
MSVGADFYRFFNKERLSAARLAQEHDESEGREEWRLVIEVQVYINKLVSLAHSQGIATPEIDDEKVTRSNYIDMAIQAEHFLDRLYAENIAELDNSSGLGSISLDAAWKTKVTAYVAHIREVVAKAQVQEAIRERIFKALGQLQLEIDRNRTRPQAWAEVWLPMTEAIGRGAKNLEPAIRLLERGAGAISRLRTGIAGGHLPPRLPPPDDLGLNDDLTNP